MGNSQILYVHFSIKHLFFIDLHCLRDTVLAGNELYVLCD